MNSLLKYNYNQKYILWDFETENLRLIGKNRPWQIGYVIAQGDKIIKEQEDYILWDNLGISSGAAKVTKFNPFKYRENAKFNKELLDEFEYYLYNPEYICIAHNSHNFDCFVHNIWRNELKLSTDYSYLNKTIDSNALARMIKLGIKDIQKENWKKEMFRFAEYVEKGLKTSIKVLSKEFELDYQEDLAHSALYDAKKNLEIWNKLKGMIEI
jgi:DNA polymerase III epsilon subunit-like protein